MYLIIKPEGILCPELTSEFKHTSEVEVAQEENVTDELNFQLVTVQEFLPLFRKYFPSSKEDP